MATSSIAHYNGVPVLVCPPDGPQLSDGGDALELVAEAGQHDVELVAVPVERFAAEFFTLSTGLAGEFLQKFANYRLRLAIVGDVSPYTEQSSAVRDFVREANRGRQVRFVAHLDDLHTS